MLLGALLRRDHELTVGDEVVWVKMLGGGSLVLAMPMLLGLRRAHPNVRMVLVTTPAVKPFAELLGVFDEYRVIDTSSVSRALDVARDASADVARGLHRRPRGAQPSDDRVHDADDGAKSRRVLARRHFLAARPGVASRVFQSVVGSYHFYDRIADLFGVAIASQAECERALLGVVRRRSEPPQRVAGQVAIGFACSDLGSRANARAPHQWVSRVRGEPSRRRIARSCFLGGRADRARADEIIATLAAPCIRRSRIRQRVRRVDRSRESSRCLFASVGVLGHRLEPAAPRAHRRAAVRLVLGPDRSGDTLRARRGTLDERDALPQDRVLAVRAHQRIAALSRRQSVHQGAVRRPTVIH